MLEIAGAKQAGVPDFEAPAQYDGSHGSTPLFDMCNESGLCIGCPLQR